MTHRPIRFYSGIEVRSDGDRITVTAKGSVAAVGRYPTCPKRTEYTFLTTYVLEGETVAVRFETDLPYDRVRMRTAETSRATHIDAFGFEEARELPLGEKDTLAPHGAYTYAKEHTAQTRGAVGWTATLPM